MTRMLQNRSVHHSLYCTVAGGLGGGFIWIYSATASNRICNCAGTVQMVGEALIPLVLATAILCVSYK
jgi:hypothetical protein